MDGRLRIQLKYRVGMLLLACGVLAAILLTNLFSPSTVARSQNVYLSDTAVMQQMVALTNALRKEKQLAPLEPSAALERSAQAKLHDMSENQYWGHYRPDGASFSRFIWAEDASAVTVGENLARCFNTYQDAFHGLVDSPTHYRVLTGDYSYIGVASTILPNGCESIVMHVSS